MNSFFEESTYLVCRLAVVILVRLVYEMILYSTDSKPDRAYLLNQVDLLLVPCPNLHQLWHLALIVLDRQPIDFLYEKVDHTIVEFLHVVCTIEQEKYDV